MTQAPQSLTLAGLRHRCAQESNRFFLRQSHDPRYCYELFRRAVLQRDEHAWGLIYAQYRPLVSGWVERNPAFPVADEEAQYFVNRAFEKMWQGLNPDKFADFHDLKSVLRYLQMCVHSVIVDYVRRKEHQKQMAPDEEMTDLSHTEGADSLVEERVAAGWERQALWDWLQQQLNDEKEYAVVYGSYVLGMKPGDLYAQNKKLFRDVKELYRIKENVIARLRRSEEFAAKFGID